MCEAHRRTRVTAHGGGLGTPSSPVAGVMQAVVLRDAERPQVQRQESHKCRRSFARWRRDVFALKHTGQGRMVTAVHACKFVWLTCVFVLRPHAHELVTCMPLVRRSIVRVFVVLRLLKAAKRQDLATMPLSIQGSEYTPPNLLGGHTVPRLREYHGIVTGGGEWHHVRGSQNVLSLDLQASMSAWFGIFLFNQEEMPGLRAPSKAVSRTSSGRPHGVVAPPLRAPAPAFAPTRATPLSTAVRPCLP